VRRSAKESLLSAILLGAMLAASTPVAADEATDSSITSWVNEALRHDPLVVRPEEKSELREKAVHVSDGALAKAIREDLAEDIRVDASEIEARASDGQVTLEGSVTNLAQKRMAEQDARDVVGVAWVTNDLFVKTERREDWIIRDDVDFDLETDSALGPFDLESSVKDGVVTLTGRVHDASQKSRATYVAGRVREVREVVNEIRVQPATGTNTKHSDAALARAIRDSFRRHGTASSVADRIRVGVDDGVATLTGDLDTWDERLEAGSVALGTEGIWKVQNRLTVKGYDYEWEKWEYEAPYYYEELFPNVG
jgi:osmotically-inducible protein OsmY